MFEGNATEQRGAPFRTNFLTLINAYWHNRCLKLKAGKNTAATPEMVKAHKRKNSGSMRRASRVYLTEANVGKAAALKIFLLLYVNVVKYFIERFWSMKDFTAALADKTVTSRAVNRFKITARLAQCAAKQGKEIFRSQKERKVKTMPLMWRKVATLDNRFVNVEEFKGKAFDLALSFATKPRSGVTVAARLIAKIAREKDSDA
jgi:hypothetical protein